MASTSLTFESDVYYFIILILNTFLCSRIVLRTVLLPVRLQPPEISKRDFGKLCKKVYKRFIGSFNFKCEFSFNILLYDQVMINFYL